MKLSIFKTILGAATAALLASTSANATVYNLTVGLTDSHSLGDVIHTLNAGGGQLQRDIDFVNTVLDLGLNGTDSSTYSPDIVTRSGNNFGALGDATATGGVIASGGGINGDGTTVTITLTSKFTYFVAAYDGQNGGTEAFYIGNLNIGDVIKITQNAQPSSLPGHHLIADSGQYGMTGWALLNSTTPTQQGLVPDGGATVALLGCAFMGIEVLRRRMLEA